MRNASSSTQASRRATKMSIGMPTLMAGYNVESVSRGIDTMMERYPVGVTAAITPFNFPLMVPLWTLPIAIAAGNTYILKPSERTPLSAVRLVELLAEAGLPAGVVNLVHGAADAVQAICADPEIDEPQRRLIHGRDVGVDGQTVTARLSRDRGDDAIVDQRARRHEGVIVDLDAVDAGRRELPNSRGGFLR